MPAAIAALASSFLSPAVAGAAAAVIPARPTAAPTVAAFGDAPTVRNVGAASPFVLPVVAMAASPDGEGYWLATAGGDVYSFGDAHYRGGLAGGPALAYPVVAMAATTDGQGYWLATAGGDVYSFGDALYRGGLAGGPYPVVAMAATPDGGGYWLATAAGAVYSFGDAHYHGGLADGPALPNPVVAMVATPDGDGYWLATAAGAVYSFGDARHWGAPSAVPPDEPVDGIVASVDGLGYWLIRGQRETAEIFTAPVLAALGQRAGQFSAAVLDLRTGGLYQLHAGWEGITASIVKVEILGTLLAQHRSLGTKQQAEATGMIELSDNGDATSLWDYVGGAPAVAAFDRQVGMTATTPNVAWGLTTTTAADQVDLLRYVVEPNPVLSTSARAYMLGLMENVTPSEAWGVSAATAAGTTVAIKNGWLPRPGGWEVNSIGWVHGAGRDYLIAVLTFGSATEQYGIATVSTVATAAWEALGPVH